MMEATVINTRSNDRMAILCFAKEVESLIVETLKYVGFEVEVKTEAKSL